MTTPVTTPPRLTPEQVEQLARIFREINEAVHRILDALRPALQATAEDMARLVQHLHAAGAIDTDGRPTHRNRPAWQSPYGPPPRRRR